MDGEQAHRAELLSPRSGFGDSGDGHSLRAWHGSAVPTGSTGTHSVPPLPPKYFGSFWHPILANEKPSTWFTFWGLYLTSDGMPIHLNNVVAGKEVKVLPGPLLRRSFLPQLHPQQQQQRRSPLPLCRSTL